jgi:hypothetical protein
MGSINRGFTLAVKFALFDRFTVEGVLVGVNPRLGSSAHVPKHRAGHVFDIKSMLTWTAATSPCVCDRLPRDGVTPDSPGPSNDQHATHGPIALKLAPPPAD